MAEFEQMPQTPFMDAFGIKAPRVKIGEIREDARKAKEAFLKAMSDAQQLAAKLRAQGVGYPALKDLLNEAADMLEELDSDNNAMWSAMKEDR